MSGVLTKIATYFDYPLEDGGWTDLYPSGAMASRPAGPVTGQNFFDTTLAIPIWWNGTNWVDATGATV